MPATTILYDGWPLCRAPLSSPALHLLDILSNSPDGVAAHLAVPESAPDWIPDGIGLHQVETPDTPSGKLGWEQRVLPRLVGRLGAALHLTTATAPLFGSHQVFASIAEGGRPASAGGFSSRLRLALGRGGTARARLIWPADVPLPREIAGRLDAAPPHETAPAPGKAPVELPPAVLPLAVDPRFRPFDRFLPPQIPGAPELPASFYLVHIHPHPDTVRRALEAWTWAAGPIGEVYPLLFLGLPETLQEHARALARRHHLKEETIVFYPAVRPADLHLLYQTASAVFCPEPIGPWHSPLRLGLASGAPVVAVETAVSGAIAGPAAYLVPPDDPRKTGSALIAVIIKDELRKKLRDAAVERVKSWSVEGFREGLGRVYRGG